MCLALVNGAIESVMDADVKVPELQRLSFLVALWKPLTAIYVKEARVACWRTTDHQVTNWRVSANGRPVLHWLGNWHRWTSESQPRSATMLPRLLELPGWTQPDVWSTKLWIKKNGCFKSLSFGVTCYAAKTNQYTSHSLSLFILSVFAQTIPYAWVILRPSLPN